MHPTELNVLQNTDSLMREAILLGERHIQALKEQLLRQVSHQKEEKQK